MINYEEILSFSAYELRQKEKEEIYVKYIKELMMHHIQKCEEYRKFIELLDEKDEYCSVKDFPFLPVSIFKELDLQSITDEEIFKTMTSSGTTGQKTSKIFLDKNTASNQQKTLAAIMESYIGKKRLPMLIIDTEAVIKDRKMFSARGAGILGFSIFGSHRMYALDENMQLKTEEIRLFLEKHAGEKIFVFGFTYMIWNFFYKVAKEKNIRFEIDNAIMIHGGGWKKLKDEAVDSATYRKCINSVSGISQIYDYYGMVEQTGCIYVECSEGYLHTSMYSDVIIRRAEDFSVCDIGEEGIVQVVSLLPESYPGHSILTEDKGTLFGIDTCKCGKCGKYFKIHGRLKNAEIRGCSDTFERRV